MIQHVLLDADGVLQDLPGGWVEALTPFLGDRAEAFWLESVEAEQPCLVGQGDFLALLTDQLARWEVDQSADGLYAAVWHRIQIEEASVALVHELRAAGLGVHLATTQEAGRAAYMKGLYDGLFDSAFYSCELGLVKTQPEFFRRVTAELGVDPHQVMFVDDSEPNVAAARQAGLVAERWHLSRGMPELGMLLSRHGLLAG